MKKLTALFLLVVMVFTACVPLAAAETTIEPDMKLNVSKPSFTAVNPVIDGVDPVSGLPTNGEAYTPILQVLDGSEIAYPHWGVESASAIFQVPNQGTGNNKLLALYTTEFPEKAGGSRSARMAFLPIANMFGAIFVAAGTPPIDPGEKFQVNVEYWRRQWGMTTTSGRWYDMNGNNALKERSNAIPAPHNLLVFIRKIHEKALADNLQFEQRPFLFTDEPLTRGESATVINARFYENNDHKTSNKASNCAFYYQEGINCYFRQSLMGKAEKNNVDFNYDRATENMLTFSNVIVLRIPFKSQNAHGTFYSYTDGHYTGSGQADIFQNGRYIKGAWYRDDLMGRLILIDDEGNELKLQRGKTFFIVNDSRCVVSYE